MTALVISDDLITYISTFSAFLGDLSDDPSEHIFLYCIYCSLPTEYARDAVRPVEEFIGT